MKTKTFIATLSATIRAGGMKPDDDRLTDWLRAFTCLALTKTQAKLPRALLSDLVPALNDRSDSDVREWLVSVTAECMEIFEAGDVFDLKHDGRLSVVQSLEAWSVANIQPGKSRVAILLGQIRGRDVSLELRQGSGVVKKLELSHKQMPTLLKVLSAGCNAYLAGPAGSGKTSAAEQTAAALGLKFHVTGAVSTEYQLLGFVDARGVYHTTPFRTWCVEGGVFLWDEIDASDARAMLRFNAALANRVCEFPDGQIIRLHESCLAIAAANTFGRGADRVYVGRNQLDGASLDRFVFIDWGYDDDLELRIGNNPSWTKRVQAIRTAATELSVRHVISPRASINGAKLLALGVAAVEVEEMVIWKGLDRGSVAKIQAHLAA